MFFSLFSSKNQKLVKKWKKEHTQIVLLAHKVIAAYSLNDLMTTKKELKALNLLAVNHLMAEDVELYDLLRDSGRLNDKTEKLIAEFTQSFRTTKIALMGFLTKYTKDDAILDEIFFKDFNDIVGVLGERIDFEEKNLYSELDH